jgi:hypothetical protein
MPKIFGALRWVNNMICFSSVNFQDSVLRGANKHAKMFWAVRTER